MIGHTAGVEGSPLLTEVVRAARDHMLAAARSDGKTYVETSHRMTFLIPAIREAYPKAKFVVLHRSPVAFARSAIGRQYFVGNRLDDYRIGSESAAWAGYSNLEKVLKLWNETYEFALAAICDTNDKQRLLLSATDLWSEAGQTTLWDFVHEDTGAPSKGIKFESQATNVQQSDIGDDPASLQPSPSMVARLCPVAEQLGYGDLV